MDSPVGAQAETPGRFGLLGLLKSFSSPTPAAAQTAKPSTPPTLPTPPMTTEQLAQHVAAQVDAAREVLVAEETKARVEMAKPSRNPYVKPDSPVYITMRKQFRQKFQVNETSVELILETKSFGFTEGDIHGFLMPPSEDGARLKLQKKKAEEYKKNLAPGGTFAGEKDNLITKLTMLYFGLPIAPITHTNILNASKDEEDPEPTPADLPRIQRIMFAEKPLEFLDLYHTRSYGFPAIRNPKPRPKPKVTKTTVVSRAGTAQSRRSVRAATAHNGSDLRQLSTTTRYGQPPAPILPTGDKVSTRGGGSGGKHDDKFWLYYYPADGSRRKRIELGANKPGKSDDFMEKALALLGMTDVHPFKFFVDQYRDPEAHKSDEMKQLVRIFPLNEKNFEHQYVSYLKARLYNQNHDWPMFIRRDSEEVRQEVPIGAAYMRRTLPQLLIEGLESWEAMNTPKGQAKQPTPPASTKNRLAAKATQKSPAKQNNQTATTQSKSPTKAAAKSPNESNQAGPNNPGTTSKTAAVKSAPPRLTASSETAPSADLDEPDLHPDNASGVDELTIHYIDPVTDAITPTIIQKTAQSLHEALHRCGRSYPDYALTWSTYYHDRGATPKPLENGATIMAESELEAQFFHIFNMPAENQAKRVIAIHETMKEPITQWPDTINAGWIYGYAGKIRLYCREEDVRMKATRLLGISDPINDNWAINVDIHPHNTQAGIETYRVTKQDFPTFFTSHIQHALGTPRDWKVFFRNPTAPISTMLEPPPTQANIVRISNEQDPEHIAVGYWKLPDYFDIEYGLNQYQPEFFRAMKVLFPVARPCEGLSLNNAFIGFGGMEVTHEVLEEVRTLLSPSATEPPTLTVQPYPRIPKRNMVGIRMAGNDQQGEFPRGNFDRLLTEILSMSQTSMFRDKAHDVPPSFRIWATATNRENGVNSEVIMYNPRDQAITTLGNFLGNIDTCCVWFRPEWTVFDFQMLDSDGATAIHSWTVPPQNKLDSFKKFINQELNLDSTPGGNVLNFVDPQRGSPWAFYLVTGMHNEDDFRRDVFDWFQSGIFDVDGRADDIRYGLAPTILWGSAEAQQILVSTPAPQTATPTQTQRTRTQRARPQRPLTTSPGMRLNKERLLRPVVRKPIPPKYDSYVIEQNRLDRLQRESYHKLQSVVEPGQKPEAPYFGQTKELMLALGTSVPTIYSQRLTPTDIVQVVEENQELRNAVLDRKTKCELCGLSFAIYNVDDKRKHWQDHMEHYKIAGNCPLCDSNRWVFMDTMQRRQHLWDHQHAHESEFMEAFWEDLVCPVCDEDLSKCTTESIITHMLEHQPGLLMFCDRCGVDRGMLSDAELIHHDSPAGCVPGLTSEQTAVAPVFCARCGRDRTFETEEQRLDHAHRCTDARAGVHCRKCGFDLNQLAGERGGAARHDRVCQPPRGFKKKFCRRCAKNLSIMTEAELKTHKEDCFLKENVDLLDETRRENQKLSAQIGTQSALLARNNATTARLRVMMRDNEDRKTDLDTRLAELAKNEAVYNTRASNLQSLEDATRVAANKEPLDKCPIQGCDKLTKTQLTNMTKAEFALHILHHGLSLEFKCLLPLANGAGDCGQLMGTGATKIEEFLRHYMHRPGQGNPLPASGPNHPSDVVMGMKAFYPMAKVQADKTSANEKAIAKRQAKLQMLGQLPEQEITAFGGLNPRQGEVTPTPHTPKKRSATSAAGEGTASKHAKTSKSPKAAKTPAKKASPSKKRKADALETEATALRRTTRAVSGTPVPGAAVPEKAKKSAKGKAVLIEEEEETETETEVESPRRRSEGSD